LKLADLVLVTGPRTSRRDRRPGGRWVATFGSWAGL